jgi:hypothetical protein
MERPTRSLPLRSPTPRQQDEPPGFGYQWFDSSRPDLPTGRPLMVSTRCRHCVRPAVRSREETSITSAPPVPGAARPCRFQLT